jgi:hypothetical protein
VSFSLSFGVRSNVTDDDQNSDPLRTQSHLVTRKPWRAATCVPTLAAASGYSIFATPSGCPMFATASSSLTWGYSPAAENPITHPSKIGFHIRDLPGGPSFSASSKRVGYRAQRDCLFSINPKFQDDRQCAGVPHLRDSFIFAKVGLFSRSVIHLGALST